MTTFLMIMGLTVSTAGIAFAQSNRKFPQTKIVMTINAPIDSAFNYIVPVDLSHILRNTKTCQPS